ncbi:MAG: Fic family protein [Xanthomonadaceae bacterium]|nr:Fic family protein [Xanthomonadaceae bacterium]
MRPDDFHAPQTGRVMRTAQGYYAFVPAPPPPPIEYTQPLVRLLSAADAALSELSGIGRLLPNPYLLIASYVRREAVLSSRIEGTRTSLSDLLADEAGQPPHAPPDDVHEVRNYVEALDYGIERLATLPLSLRLVREVHERLMRGVRGDSATPGEFRRSQNWIGPHGSTPANAPYVPPPPQEMLDALAAWELFLHQRGELPDLVQCALMHEHFEAIHPFLDGNGRVGRLLITLFLIERGRLSQPLLYLSEFIERNRDDYYRSLMRIRTHGDWLGWLHYFLAGVEWSARRALRQAQQLLALRERMRNALAHDPRAAALVDALFVNPFIDIKRAQALLSVSAPTARKTLAALETAGMLRALSVSGRGRVYLADAVLAAIDDPGEERAVDDYESQAPADRNVGTPRKGPP